MGGRGRESSSPAGARGAKTRGLGLGVVAGDGRRSRLASSPPWPRRARASEGRRTIRDLGRGRGRGQGRGRRGPGSRRPAFAVRARPPGLLGGSETAGGEGSGLRTLELGCRIVRHRHGRCPGSWQGWSGRRRRGASSLGMCTVLTKRAAPKGLSKATQMKTKGQFLSKKTVGTMKLKKYLLGSNPKAQSLSPRAPGLSLKAQGLSPEALGLCLQALSLHPEVLNQILRAPGLNPRVLGMSHKALAMIPRVQAMYPGALGMNPKALDMVRRAPNLNLKAPGMNPRVPGMHRRTLEMKLGTLSSKPIAPNLKLKVPNSRKVQTCF